MLLTQSQNVCEIANIAARKPFAGIIAGAASRPTGWEETVDLMVQQAAASSNENRFDKAETVLTGPVAAFPILWDFGNTTWVGAIPLEKQVQAIQFMAGTREEIAAQFKQLVRWDQEGYLVNLMLRCPTVAKTPPMPLGPGDDGIVGDKRRQALWLDAYTVIGLRIAGNKTPAQGR